MATDFTPETKDISPAQAWNDLLIQASNYTINAGEVVELLISESVNNQTFNSLALNIEYVDVTPKLNGSYSIKTVVEHLDNNGHWQLEIGQNNEFRGGKQAPNRKLELSPASDSFSLGIDFVETLIGNTEHLRTSVKNHTMPQGNFRIRVLLVDSDPAGAGAFQSVKISMAGKLYDVLS